MRIVRERNSSDDELRVKMASLKRELGRLQKEMEALRAERAASAATAATARPPYPPHHTDRESPDGYRLRK